MRCAAHMASGAVAELDPSAARSPTATPTFVLCASERAVHTRAASADAQRRQRYLREVTLQYSLCHEPWTKYTVAAVADRGLKRAQWTSARLRTEVLYLETQRARFELAWEGLTGAASASAPADASSSAASLELSAADGALDAFRWARCRTPLALEAARAAGAPLRAADVEVRAPACMHAHACLFARTHAQPSVASVLPVSLSPARALCVRCPSGAVARRGVGEHQVGKHRCAHARGVLAASHPIARAIIRISLIVDAPAHT
jgi:hypothetical protein